MYVYIYIYICIYIYIYIIPAELRSPHCEDISPSQSLLSRGKRQCHS